MGMFSMLIGLLAAFFVYNHAKKRGHGPGIAFLWAIGSAIMPVVLVPLYFLLGRNNQPQGKVGKDDIIDIEATVIKEEFLNCFQCGRQIQDDFKVCPYCQTSLSQKEKHL